MARSEQEGREGHGRSVRGVCWALALTCSLATSVAHAQKPEDKATAKAPAEKAPVEKPVADKATGGASIDKKPWGEADGKQVDLYTLTNKKGSVAKITNYGALVVELDVPDRDGHLGDIVLGFDSLAQYVKKTPYFGATIGRVANRIAGGHFALDGKDYQLATNDGANHLHGGKKGWDKVVWTAEAKPTPRGPSLELTYVSPDGEEGYPGTVTAKTTYLLGNDNTLTVQMEATTDRPTIINMAHHGYFNLSAGADDTVLEQLLTLHASKYTPGMPPDGHVVPVAGTPFDFRKPKAIGKDLQAAGPAGPNVPVGYDSNWIVDGPANKLRPVARVEDPKSGRVMTIEANQPGVQLYAGGFLDGTSQGKGHKHQQYGAVVLETQSFPNAINVPAWKEQMLLKPGRAYKHTMIYRFTSSKAPSGTPAKH